MANLTDDEIIWQLVEQEYDAYAKDFKPLLSAVEVYINDLPDGLLNEIRSFTGHISDALTKKSDTLDERKKNIESAHRHLERIILDCYKMLCLYHDEDITFFNNRYRWVDLTSVDDGKFVVRLTEKVKDAHDAELEAKNCESLGNNNHSVLITKYQDAFNKYMAVDTYIANHLDGINSVSHKNKVSKIINIVLAVWGAIGTALGIILPIVLT